MSANLTRGWGFSLTARRSWRRVWGPQAPRFPKAPPATGPITHNFFGQFQTAGALVAPTSGVIAFTEARGGISDILTFTYTGGGGSPGGPFGVATLTGSFVSDLESGGSLVAPPGATLVSEATPFNFSNTNIDASAVSDVEPVPAPLLGHGLFALLAIGGVLFGGKLLKKYRPQAA